MSGLGARGGQLRVLILGWGFDPERQGGIARFCIQIARGLAAVGVDTELWGLLAAGTARERAERAALEALGIRTRLVPRGATAAGTTLRALYAAVARTRRGRHDVVSVHGALADICGLAIKVTGRSQVIRTVHSEYESYKRPALGRLVDSAYARWADGEIGVSTRITAAINQRRQRVQAPIEAKFIPPIPDLGVKERYRSLTQGEARARLNIPPNQFVIGSVGRLTPQKGFDTLIEATALLNTQGKPAHVYLLGEGPLDSALRGMIARTGLGERINLLAPSGDIDVFLRALDVYVSASRWEGMSLSVLEAALVGLPVIATEVSGTDDIARLLSVQLLRCPPDDPVAVAEQIELVRATPAGSDLFMRTPADAACFEPATVAEAYLQYFASLRHAEALSF